MQWEAYISGKWAPADRGRLYSSLCAHVANRRTGRMAPALSVLFVESLATSTLADDFEAVTASAEAAALPRRSRPMELGHLSLDVLEK